MLTLPQKIGIANRQGWAAYSKNKTLFVKKTVYREGVPYPDFGSSMEAYTAEAFMEIESLGPLHHLEPDGFAEHVEQWSLFEKVEIGDNDESIEKAINPLIKKSMTK